jgi:hypothetical protein
MHRLAMLLPVGVRTSRCWWYSSCILKEFKLVVAAALCSVVAGSAAGAKPKAAVKKRAADAAPVPASADTAPGAAKRQRAGVEDA